MSESMQHWWNVTNTQKQQYFEKNLPQCNFVHDKCHTDRSGIEPNPLTVTGQPVLFPQLFAFSSDVRQMPGQKLVETGHGPHY
jgi:hypothetical protein